MSDVAREVLEARVRKPTIKQNVDWVISRHKQAAGDYRVLAYWFYRDVCGVKMNFKDFNQLRRCPSFEMIGRRFRELWAEEQLKADAEGRENKYGPRKETRMKRLKNESVIREYYSQAGLNRWPTRDEDQEYEDDED